MAAIFITSFQAYRTPCLADEAAPTHCYDLIALINRQGRMVEQDEQIMGNHDGTKESCIRLKLSELLTQIGNLAVSDLARESPRKSSSAHILFRPTLR